MGNELCHSDSAVYPLYLYPIRIRYRFSSDTVRVRIRYVTWRILIFYFVWPFHTINDMYQFAYRTIENNFCRANSIWISCSARPPMYSCSWKLPIASVLLVHREMTMSDDNSMKVPHRALKYLYTTREGSIN